MTAHSSDLTNSLSPGLHYNVPMKSYVSDPCPEPSLSASTIKALVEKSPLKAWDRHPRLGGKRDWSRAANIGSAAHALVLEGADVIQVVSSAEDARGVLHENLARWTLKSAQEARDEIRSAGKIPLLGFEAAIVHAMAKKAGEAIRKEAGDGSPEVTLIWQEDNGVWCRARADWLSKSYKPVIDYKTTKKSAEPREWIRRSLYTDGYDVSAAWYLRGLEKLGEAKPEYKFLIQEQDPPHDYSWVGLEAGCEAIDIINRWILKAIKLWGECLKSGEWSGYPKHTFYADPAAWRAIQIEESELADDMARETFGPSDTEGAFLDEL